MADKTGTLRIALNPAKTAGRKFGAKRAIRLIKLDVKKHFRVPFENIRIAKEVNEQVWRNGSNNIPKKLDLDILKEKETAFAFLKNGTEKEAFLARQKEKTKEKKAEPPKEKKTETTQTKEETAKEKENQEKKLEEKRLKETMAEKAEFK